MRADFFGMLWPALDVAWQQKADMDSPDFCSENIFVC
jgi:hypothetical protein